MRSNPLPLVVAAIALLGLLAFAAPAPPMPTPIARRSPLPDAVGLAASVPTPQARAPMPFDASPNDVFDFYRPVARRAIERMADGVRLAPRDDTLPKDFLAKRDAILLEEKVRELAKRLDETKATPTKRSDVPSVPLSQLGPPSFPAQYPSCYNCQQKYSSLSSCMEASSVFQNATSIFNNPFSYFAVIKCACTDTFQAVYPQCVQCFQMTDQCYYLGTDPKGTGAPAIVTNIRQICALGSSLLGGAEHANYPDYNNTFTPSEVPYYTDVTAGGSGYQDQSAGPIFGAASTTSVRATLPLLFFATFASLIALHVV